MPNKYLKSFLYEDLEVKSTNKRKESFSRLWNFNNDDKKYDFASEYPVEIQ